MSGRPEPQLPTGDEPAIPAAPTPDEEALDLETQRLRAAIGARLFDRDLAAPPVKIGRHVLLEPIGAGAMGVVYAAYDPQLDRRVAIKVLQPAEALDPDSRAAARLLREAQAMAKVNHPNIVAVHDAGVVEGRVFVAMEHVDGGTLASWCERNPPGSRARFEQVLDLLLQAARGLVAAHAVGLLHRDLKPTNMLIDDNARLRVADFGLAIRIASVEHPGDASAVASRMHDRSKPTEARSNDPPSGVAGTPAYMAPEQIDGRPDARSDQWAFCATAWEAIFGMPVRTPTTLAQLRAQQSSARLVRPAARNEVPAWAFRVLSRGLADDPDARYPSMAALIRDIERRRVRRRRIVGWAVATAVVAAAAWAGADREAPASAQSQCDRLTDHVAGVYDEGAAERIERSIRGRDGSAPRGAIVRVTDRLDAFTRQWVASATRSCRALQAEAKLDPDVDPLVQAVGPMQCHRDALAQLEEIVAAELDGPTSAEAVTLVHALPSLTRCHAATADAASGTPGARDVTRSIARATIQRSLRNFAEARQLLAAAAEHLHPEASPMLHAAIESSRGSVALDLGEVDVGTSHARRALHWAEQGDDPTVVGEAWVLLADLARRGSRNDDAAFYLERARASANRAGDPEWLRASILRSEAATHLALGQHDAAHTAGVAALAAYAQAYGEGDLRYTRMLENHIEVLLAIGRKDEASAAGERILTAYRDGFGAAHPSTARAAARLASVFEETGEIDRALALYQDAFAVLGREAGVDPQDRVTVAFALAQALNNVHRVEEARRIVEIARADAVASFGAQSPMARLIRSSQAAMALDADDVLEAIAIYEELREAPKGADPRAQSINEYVACVNLATSYARADRTKEALAEVAACEVLADRVQAPPALLFAASNVYLAEVYQRAGRPERARELYRSAAEQLDEQGPLRSERAAAHVGLAELDIFAGTPRDVDQHLAVAREVLAHAPDPRIDRRLQRIDAARRRAVPG